MFFSQLLDPSKETRDILISASENVAGDMLTVGPCVSFRVQQSVRIQVKAERDSTRQLIENLPSADHLNSTFCAATAQIFLESIVEIDGESSRNPNMPVMPSQPGSIHKQ